MKFFLLLISISFFMTSIFAQQQIRFLGTNVSIEPSEHYKFDSVLNELNTPKSSIIINIYKKDDIKNSFTVRLNDSEEKFKRNDHQYKSYVKEYPTVYKYVLVIGNKSFYTEIKSNCFNCTEEEVEEMKKVVKSCTVDEDLEVDIKEGLIFTFDENDDEFVKHRRMFGENNFSSNLISKNQQTITDNSLLKLYSSVSVETIKIDSLLTRDSLYNFDIRYMGMAHDSFQPISSPKYYIRNGFNAVSYEGTYYKITGYKKSGKKEGLYLYYRNLIIFHGEYCTIIRGACVKTSIYRRERVNNFINKIQLND